MAEKDTPVVVPATRPAGLDRYFGDAPSKRQKADDYAIVEREKSRERSEERKEHRPKEREKYKERERPKGRSEERSMRVKEKTPQKLPDSAPAVQLVAVAASVASVALPGPASKLHPQQTVSSTPKSVQKQFVAPVVKLAQQKPTAAAAAPAPVTVVSGKKQPNVVSVAQSATQPLIHAPNSVQPQQTLTKLAAPIPKVARKQLAVPVAKTTFQRPAVAAAATETTTESAICVKLEPAGVVLKSAEKQSQNTKPGPVFQQQRQQQPKAMAPVPQPPTTNLVRRKLVLSAPKVVRPPAPKPKPVTTAVPFPAPAPALAVTTKSFSAPSGSQLSPVHASVQRSPPPLSLEVRQQDRAPAPSQINALPVLGPLAVSPSLEVLSTRPVSHTRPSPVSHSPKSQAAFQEQVQSLQLPSKSTSTSSALAPPVQQPQIPYSRHQSQTQGHRPELQDSVLMSPPVQQTSEPVVRQQLQNWLTKYMDLTPEPVAVPAAAPTAAPIPNPSHSTDPLVGQLLPLTQQGIQDLSISQHRPQMQLAPPVAAAPRPPSPMHTDAALMTNEPILTAVSEESSYNNGVASFRASAHDMLEQIKTMADIMLRLSSAGTAGAAGNAMGNLDVTAFNQKARRAATLATALFGPVASGGSSSPSTGAVTDSTTVKVNPELMQ
ncbi:hypothetical protein GGF37_005591 [Kickxella alabastrina]|nr:hypothetical protein GGF37_005591 [Kickxella alabastrina]